MAVKEHVEKRVEKAKENVKVGEVNAILFDPKKDNRKLEVHEWWEEVRDPELLSDLLGFIYLNAVNYPSLRVIKDPKDNLYGYLYSVWWTTPIKVIDDKTMWIDDLSTNPFEQARVGH